MRLNKAPAIDFDNVSFGYGDRTVLRQLDLHIKPGEKIGIVGLSGAGKTTVCNLMLRMYDVDVGAILINGTDIRDVKQDSLRQNISFVPQESVLFNKLLCSVYISQSRQRLYYRVFFIAINCPAYLFYLVDYFRIWIWQSHIQIIIFMYIFQTSQQQIQFV